jgi:hypothetical protein
VFSAWYKHVSGFTSSFTVLSALEGLLSFTERFFTGTQHILRDISIAVSVLQQTFVDFTGTFSDTAQAICELCSSKWYHYFMCALCILFFHFSYQILIKWCHFSCLSKWYHYRRVYILVHSVNNGTVV